MLRTLLTHADEDPQVGRLLDAGGRAFVSQSLRPYLLAALIDRAPDRPAIVVAGDDRAARDLAAGLKTWLEPRTGASAPARAGTSESPLAPPPDLVGLRIAALDALLEGGGGFGPSSGQTSPHPAGPNPGSGAQSGVAAPVVVVSAVALSEKVPDPALRPHGFVLKPGELLDLDETAR